MAKRMTKKESQALATLIIISAIVGIPIFLISAIVKAIGVNTAIITIIVIVVLFVSYKIIRREQKINFANEVISELELLKEKDLPSLSILGMAFDKDEKILFREPFTMYEGNLKAVHSGTLMLTDKKISFNSISALITVKGQDIISIMATPNSFIVGQKGKKRQYYFCTDDKVSLAKLVAYFAIITEGSIERVKEDLYKILRG